jgi:hypothetical protein
MPDFELDRGEGVLRAFPIEHRRIVCARVVAARRQREPTHREEKNCPCHEKHYPPHRRHAARRGRWRRENPD